jgi:serine/threonine protein kinase
VARVLDFGIAKALGRSQATRDGEVKGKIAYMAPEQIFGEQVTRRTDIFATAVVMWEALTGKRLVLGETESETIVRVGRMKIEPPSTLAEVPQALDEVVYRALDREAENRFDRGDFSVAGNGISGEENPRCLRIDHPLDDDRHGDLPLIETVAQAIGDGALGEERGPAAADLLEDRSRPDDVQAPRSHAGRTAVCHS